MAVSFVLALLCAQDLPPKQEDVDAAIEKGANWLLAKAGEGIPSDVSINAGLGLSYHGLVLYALNHAGVDRDHPGYRRLVEQVAATKITRTYTAACTAMALRAHDPTRYKEKIHECAQFLVDNQCENGQWNYGEAYEIPKMPKVGDSGSTRVRLRVTRSKKRTTPIQKVGDNSNSQYAALGLHASWMAGLDIEEEVVKRAIQWWEDSQLEDGSWHYAEKGEIKPKEPGFGSMTAGGGSSIVLLRRIRGHTTYGKAQKAMSWLGAHFTVSENPNAPEDRKRFHFYYLYALERLGDLYPSEKMGKHLWYAEGANWLVKNQKGGMWQWPQGGMEIPDTCFAILFLRRASKVATGGTNK